MFKKFLTSLVKETEMDLTTVGNNPKLTQLMRSNTTKPTITFGLQLEIHAKEQAGKEDK